MPLKIESIDLYPIYDSSGGATLEATVNGHLAACPNGTSVGAYEAHTLPIKQALSAFEKVKKEFIAAFSQMSFDSKLAKLMPKLGAQATTALSLAFYINEQSAKPITSNSHATPVSNSFPNLLGNVLGGGAHSIKTKLSMQEILVLPRTRTLTAAIETNFKIWHEVGEALAKRGFCGLNHEAAWTADITDEAALNIVIRIAKRNRAHVGVDVAASQFYKNNAYVWSDRTLSREAHIARIIGFAKKFKLAYIEDPVQQDDFAGFSEILGKLKHTLVCGDDLTATNIDRLKRATRERAINAIVIKPNQTGTVSNCINVINHATKNKITPIISHRSRETPDTAICKLAQLCPIAKFGIAGIRTVKLNGLMRLWHKAQKPRIVETNGL